MHPSFPAKLGRYEILEEIGKGAMGVVYLARDPLIGRQVALKTFRVGLSVRDAELDQFRARFMREAQSAGILSHPNIVTIHDVVESGDEGLAFIAMEYVRGTNLKSVLQDGRPLTLTYVADVVGQIADALEYAHSCKVVHRDVKPANILITHDGRVKITDFGIARLDTSNLTQEGQLLGTPNYMSPEQILGREIDHRADIFSLGVVLYEMLTRHKPFQGDNLTVVSHRIVYDSFTPIRDYVRELPPGVERILHQALEKDPGRRFQRARELGEELRRVVGVPNAEALNETQGLSTTLVLPPSALRGEGTAAPPGLPPIPPLPPGPSAAGDPSSTHPGTATGTAAALAGAGTVVPTLRRGWGVPGWSVAAGVVLLLLAGAAAGFWLWRRQAVSAAPPATSPAASLDLEARQAETLARQGQEKLAGGDVASAVALLAQAQQLAPDRADLAQLLAHAQRLADERSRMTGQQLTFAAKLAEARVALDARRFDEAEAATAAALQLQPDDPEAARLLEAVRAGRAGQRRERLAEQARRENRAPQETPPGTGGEAEAPPPVPTAPPTEAASRPAVLRINFSSQLPEGVVMVVVNGKVVLREDFRYYEGGRFRPRPTTGSFSQQIEVPVGNNDVRILVTPRGQGAKGKSFGGNFLGGRTRNLDVSLTQSGEVQANLS